MWLRVEGWMQVSRVWEFLFFSEVHRFSIMNTNWQIQCLLSSKECVSRSNQVWIWALPFIYNPLPRPAVALTADMHSSDQLFQADWQRPEWKGGRRQWHRITFQLFSFGSQLRAWSSAAERSGEYFVGTPKWLTTLTLLYLFHHILKRMVQESQPVTGREVISPLSAEAANIQRWTAQTNRIKNWLLQTKQKHGRQHNNNMNETAYCSHKELTPFCI